MPTGEPRPDRATPRRSGRDGFTLVWLAVTVTLLNVWVAASLPLWSYQIQRGKEAELIFRGLQIAEGIRVYLIRTGQYPTSLRQMVEHEPRCLRQLWANPLRDDGRWGLIPVGTGGPGGRGQGGRGTNLDGSVGQRPNGQRDPARGGADGLDPQGRPGEDGLPTGTILSAPATQEGPGATPQTVAFRGVFHPGGEEATRLFLDAESTSEWRFTVELVSALRRGTPTEPLANPRPFLVEQIGRPWPAGVIPLVAMPSPDGQPGGAGQPGQPSSDGSGHLGAAAAERGRAQQQQEGQQPAPTGGDRDGGR